MPEAFSIRRAGKADLGAIVGLRIEFERITRDSGSLDVGDRRDARAAELEALLGADLESGRLVAWLAEEGGRPIAQAALRLRKPSGVPAPAAGPGPRGSGELLNVYTKADFRGRGIGSALVAAAIAEALELGLSRLTLQGTDDSRRIYERAGFRARGGRMLLDLSDIPRARNGSS